MLAGIKDILIITTPEDQNNFIKLLGDGSNFGVNFTFKVQEKPNGLAEAFIIGEEFINGDKCAMVLGDNLFYGAGFTGNMKEAVKNAKNNNATIFGFDVRDPGRFGIMEFDKNKKIISVEEKPMNPKSNTAIVGLYFYPEDVCEKAKMIKPSSRGELEITTLNDMYLQEERLKAEVLPEGFTWFDTGTFSSLLDASTTIKTIESVKGTVVCCLEQIGYDNGWLSTEKLEERYEIMKKNSYGEYLKKVLKRGKK